MAGRIVINSRYQLDEHPLARGGMGEVWTGRDIRLGREIAVKFIRFPVGEPEQEMTRRFVRESRIAARLEHPGVPAVYDAGTYDGRPYLVMQRIHGISVADLNAEQAPMPIGWAAAIAAQVCSVLVDAHHASLVHRDLKPSNLMLDQNGGVKVLDFGLAVALDLTDSSQITRTGQTLGTPAYMAPEQIVGGTSTPQTDLYGLGCTLHEMLTGKPPFVGPNQYTVMNRQVDERPPGVRELRPDVPAELELLLLALLEKRPENRPASAKVVYDRLLPFVDELHPLPGVHRPPSDINALHMYAGVVARIHIAVPDSPPQVQLDRRPIDRSELDRAREQASQLLHRSHYRTAAEVLGAVIEPATRAFGALDDDVVSLREQHANVLLDGGAFRPAARQFRQLARDLATRHGPDAEQVLHCRLQAAKCHAMLGETSRALVQLIDLLADQRRIHGDDDPQTLELRRQIGLLQLGAGEMTEAVSTFRLLAEDLGRIYGPDHPRVAEISGILAHRVHQERHDEDRGSGYRQPPSFP